MMTISRKERMLSITNHLVAYEDKLPQSVKENLSLVKNKLQTLTATEVERLSDKVISTPASEQHIDMSTPENILHSSYHELDRLSRENDIPDGLQQAIQEMRYYFSIEEKDGFFP